MSVALAGGRTKPPTAILPARRGEYKIPFDHLGDQQAYPEDVWIDRGLELEPLCYEPVWVENYRFHDTLLYVGFHKYQRAAYMEFSRLSNGAKVFMFLPEFHQIAHHFRNGSVTDEWTFIKRGHSYGVQPYRAPKKQVRKKS